MFKKIEGDQAMISQGGVYKPVDLYEYRGQLFIKDGSGYQRLKANGSTSKDGVNLIEIHTEAPLWSDQFGRLCTEAGKNRKKVELAPPESDSNGPLLLEKKS